MLWICHRTHKIAVFHKIILLLFTAQKSMKKPVPGSWFYNCLISDHQFNSHSDMYLYENTTIDNMHTRKTCVSVGIFVQFDSRILLEVKKDWRLAKLTPLIGYFQIKNVETYLVLEKSILVFLQICLGAISWSHKCVDLLKSIPN